MLPEQKTIVRKFFRDLVHCCDLHAIMRKMAQYDETVDEFMNKITLQDNDRFHNNRIILFRLLELDSDKIFHKFIKSLRDNDFAYIANKLENKPDTPPKSTIKHRTCCFKLPDEVIDTLPKKVIDYTQSLKIKIHNATVFSDNINAYRTRSKNRGHILIINNINFTTHPRREGAEVDERNLQELFEKLGFGVFLHRNLTKEEMEMQIEKFTTMDSTYDNAPDIGMFIVMSHGEKVENKTVVIGSDDKGLEEDWIIKQFNNYDCKIFRRKPKILIFHICRGELVDNLVLLNQHTEPDAACTKKPEMDEDDRYLSDIIICHPSLEGFQAHRDTLRGCWYIELMCKVFMEKGYRLDVESMLKEIEDQLKQRISEKKTRQTSTFLNIAFRNCYLNPGIYEEGDKVVEFENAISVK